MSDEQIKQRIAYLVEHGGLWDDPMAEIRKMVRVNRILAAAALILLATDLVLNVVS